MNILLKKIKRKWSHLWLQPIRVFCLHHVCETFDAESMNEYDWMQIDEFKAKVLSLQKYGVQFISITAAYTHICKDLVRSKKYAVLTFDDGYASLKEILPWLEEQKIPVVLFINGKYLDGKSYRKNPNEKYLTKEELFSITSPLIEVGSHGWKHVDASLMSKSEFVEYIDQNVQLLSKHSHYVSFHAYTWGTHTMDTDAYLLSNDIIPVYIDGMKNYNEPHIIHRELL